VQSFKQYINEGINDPAIFKVIFTAGGPGSGKSFTANKTGLAAMGFRFINSDDAFERALEKAGLDSGNSADVYSKKGQKLRASAVELTGKRMELAIQQRLGLVIDGTGKDYDKIKQLVTKFRRIGYECAMIFVNTDLQTAIDRDIERGKNPKGGRTLGAPAVSKMWSQVQRNMGKFQNLFKGHMYIVDNNEGQDINKAVLSAYRKIRNWSEQEPRMPQAKAWMAPKTRA